MASQPSECHSQSDPEKETRDNAVSSSITRKVFYPEPIGMSPPITVSITRVQPDRWNLGSSMVCDVIRDPDATPADAVICWQDGDHTFCLRKITGTTNDLSVGDAEIDRVHVGGVSAAVWCIGEDTFCKAHGWCEGQELEASTIEFVRSMAPEIPVPEVIYSWIDHALDRTFLITKRVRGRPLEQTWPQLSSTQRTRVAHDVAQICETLIEPYL